MWPYHPELLARAVPRYTSFPTAAEFHDGVGAEVQEQAIRDARGSVSLYVHIPFCTELCWYCGCTTGTVGNGSRLAWYMDALEREIERVSALLPESTSVDRIAFGGGSPNALSPIVFVRLLDKLLVAFRSCAPQISIEIDPRHFSDEWMDMLGAAQISHVSLGVQTFAPDVQAAIGRVQPFSGVERSVRALRRAGVTSLNFDLMYGLPKQGAGDLADTLSQTVALGADRISLFGYAHVPHIIARQRRIDGSALPNQADRFAMAARGFERLTSAGYVAVGFDHFALPHDPLAIAAGDGTLRRNFQGFCEDPSPTQIGLGASAISCFAHVIIQNEKNPGRYRMRVSQGRCAGVVGVARAAEDAARGAAIVDILSNRSTDLAGWISDGLLAGLAPFVEKGLVRLEGSTLHPTLSTRPYARSIAALLDPYRASTPQRFSTAI